MSPDTFIIIASILVGFTLIYLLLKNQIDKPKTDPVITAWLKSLQASFDKTNTSNSLMVQKNYQDLFQRLDQTTSLIGELKREAGAFSEVSRSMKDLHEYLKSPKLRGNIGEQVLFDLVSQIFPTSSFEPQYHFKSGSIVDMAIRTQSGLLPIDSKFPMENFQKMHQSTSTQEKQLAKSQFIRDVKSHLKSISSKYILPSEGTLDFALMYIPSESVYYEVVVEAEIMNLSRDIKVYPVSPSTLYANLQTILISLEGQKLAGKTSQIFQRLKTIIIDYDKLGADITLLSKHLTNAYNALNSTRDSHSELGRSLDSVSSLKQISATTNQEVDPV